MIVLNEKVYAEECLKNKTISDKPFFTLSILAKYYYYCFNYKKSKIVKLLIEFISSNYDMYECNKMTWDDNIEKIVKNVNKYKLFEIDGVWITDSELDVISKIQNKTLEKIAFTLLCLAKLGNIKNPKNNSWVNNDDKEIFNLARVTCTVAQRDEKLSDLYELKLLDFPKRIDNLSCRVTFVDDSSEKKLFISDFRELGYAYLKYLGENYIECRECGRLFKAGKKHRKYCSQCRAKDDTDVKNITCVDCGKLFQVKNKNNTSCRCKNCQDVRNKEIKKIWYEKTHKEESD